MCVIHLKAESVTWDTLGGKWRISGRETTVSEFRERLMFQKVNYLSVGFT